MSEKESLPTLAVELGPLRLTVHQLSGGRPRRPERKPIFQVDPPEATFSVGAPLEPGWGPVLFEETEYQFTLELSPGTSGEVTFRTIDEAIVGAVQRRARAPVWQGPIRFRGFVGEFPLDVLVDGRRYLSLRFEVFPTKMTYLEDHRALVDSVSGHERSLPFELVAPTTVGHAASQEVVDQRTTTEWLAILRLHAGDLTRALQAISRHPEQQIRREALVRPASQVRRASARSAAWLARHAQYAARGKPPTHLIDERRLLSPDTPENRYVVGRVRRWVRQLQELLESEPRLEGGFSQVRAALRQFDRDPVLSELTPGPAPVSHILQHVVPYRRLAAIDRALRRAVERAHRGQIPLTLKSLHRLYEYWVLLEVHSTLIQALGFTCTSERPPLIPTRSQANLQNAGLLRYKRSDGATATLTYQGLFADPPADEDDDDGELDVPGGSLTSLTSAQHPDGVLILDLVHVSYPVCVVIDAKYRLGSKGVGPKTSDVNVMHRYRDALLFSRSRVPGAEPMQGVTRAWFVYPGDPTGLNPAGAESTGDRGGSARLDVRQRLWQAAFTIGVGAIPALPSRSHLLRAALLSVAGATPGELERTRPRTVHVGRVSLDPEALCLWAVVPDESRLATHEAASLYHVPEDQVADVSAVTFVLIGIRRPVGLDRSVVYRPFLHRTTLASPQALPRGSLPPGYLIALGPSIRPDYAGRYHLFHLGDRVELGGPAEIALPTSPGGYFSVLSIRDTLARLGAAWGQPRAQP